MTSEQIAEAQNAPASGSRNNARGTPRGTQSDAVRGGRPRERRLGNGPLGARHIAQNIHDVGAAHSSGSHILQPSGNSNLWKHTNPRAVRAGPI